MTAQASSGPMFCHVCDGFDEAPVVQPARRKRRTAVSESPPGARTRRQVKAWFPVWLVQPPYQKCSYAYV